MNTLKNLYAACMVGLTIASVVVVLFDAAFNRQRLLDHVAYLGLGFICISLVPVAVLVWYAIAAACSWLVGLVDNHPGE
jgi:hypothetical protein